MQISFVKGAKLKALGSQFYPTCKLFRSLSSLIAQFSDTLSLCHVVDFFQNFKNLFGMTVWPSGLGRWLKAPVRKGVGSNPTAVTLAYLRVSARACNCRLARVTIAQYNAAVQDACRAARSFVVMPGVAQVALQLRLALVPEVRRTL